MPRRKRLNVTLAGIDAVGALNLKRSYRVFDGDTRYAMELAAVVGQGVLEGRWKAIKSGGGGHGAPMSRCRPATRALPNGSEMRRQLLGLPGVAGSRVDAESAQSANLTLRFPGGPAELAAALNGHGLALESGEGGLIFVRQLSRVIGL